MGFFVYLVECSDGSYYTGYAADVQKRVNTHNLGKNGAKYTKVRRPVRLVYTEELATKSEAMKREIAIKKLSHIEKKKMCSNFLLHTKREDTVIIRK